MSLHCYEPIGVLAVDPDEPAPSLRLFHVRLEDGRAIVFQATGRREALRTRALLAEALRGHVTLRDGAPPRHIVVVRHGDA